MVQLSAMHTHKHTRFTPSGGTSHIPKCKLHNKSNSTINVAVSFDVFT